MTASGAIEVRLARTGAEIDAAQQLRYRVFFEEGGARADPGMRESRRDVDAFDAAMDHMIVIDHGRRVAQGQVIGNYRLLRSETVGCIDPRAFYSSSEFDITPLLASGQRLLELGRSCVLREYRGRPILQMLWRAIVGYAADHQIELMFGCASLDGSDPAALREQLAYLHRHHLAPLPLRPRALGPDAIDMDSLGPALVDPVRARSMLAPLVKGYLRQGAGVGNGAYQDRQFNTVDVCIVMPTAALSHMYRRHRERVIQRPLPGQHIDGPAEEVADASVAAVRWVAIR